MLDIGSRFTWICQFHFVGNNRRDRLLLSGNAWLYSLPSAECCNLINWTASTSVQVSISFSYLSDIHRMRVWCFGCCGSSLLIFNVSSFSHSYSNPSAFCSCNPSWAPHLVILRHGHHCYVIQDLWKIYEKVPISISYMYEITLAICMESNWLCWENQ